MWQAIASAETSREYWSIIGEIEHALRERVDSEYADPSMSGGAAGEALFLAYLHAAGGSADAADAAVEALQISTSALAERHLLPTLFAGFAGVGWVVTHLTRELFEGDDDLSVEIDNALRELLSEVTENPPYELIAGLAGYGTYLVERLPNPGAAELLRRIVDLLDASRDSATGTWFTNPAWLPDWQRELMPDGCYNLGVAHGVPGVIGLLAAAWRAGLGDPRIPQLTEDAVRWLLTQKHLSMEGSIFPSHVSPDGEARPTRTAWCYGDLGIAGVLLSAAQAFGRKDWQDEALAIARIAASRTFEETKTNDVGLCHGAIGLGHLFNRIHQATGASDMRDAALTWYRYAFDMRRPGEGIAGFLTWVVEPPNEGYFKAERGFLGGAAGIGLALLAAVSNVEPVWDRVMLIATPPRNGASVQ